MNLKSKIALITGAGQGIGKATAEAFARAGATVVVADINLAQAQVVADQLINAYKIDAWALRVDVSDEASVKDMMGRIQKKYARLDILVNNAGICQAAVPFEELPQADWDRMFGVNLGGPVNCVKAAIPMFKAQQYGKIINLSSLAAEIGGIAVAANYSASKAAIMCLTKSLAKYLGPYQINVNAVAPGLIKTAMTADLNQDPSIVPLKRLGEPEEVADVILFLASDRSRYITGATLDVNGGIFMN
jgi:3-oxoacyl-[acyl-carrier protein] reductase